MSFRLGDIIVDRIQYGYAEDLGTDLALYLLTQMKDATINVTAESEDVKDAQGNLVKKIWRAKAGNLDAKNALLNTNIVAAASGAGAEFATADNTIAMPRIITAKVGATGITLDGVIAGTVKVNELDTNGQIGKSYALGTTASATEFAVGENGALSLPVEDEDSTVTQYIIRYQREVEDGAKITNNATKFPKSVRLILKALYYDPCEKNTLKGCYIELPSFQVSPEVNIPLGASTAEIDYKGDLEMDYCSANKTLYNIYFANDEEDDE